MSEPGKLWVGSIVLNCKNFEGMISFWKAALGYEARQPPSEDWVVLSDPRRRGPNLSLQKVPDGPPDDYTFHLDLYSSESAEEVQRLLRLGATMRQPAEESRDFVTLADPDGNPFDVIDTPYLSFGQHVK